MDLLIGRHFDTFLVQQPLERSGNIGIYKGLDTRLKHPVTIKVIQKAEHASDTEIQQFEHKAQAIASLKHRNILAISHFGQCDNLYYFVMEYPDGADLDTIIQRYEYTQELMPHADVIRILDEIGEALDYAHEQGIIHGAVKPANILLERDGHAILTNFDLMLNAFNETNGHTFDSSRYIAPEQAHDSANAVVQSDIYSLGVVAYELLTGALPFSDYGRTTLVSLQPDGSIPSPLNFNPNLSPAVEKVLLNCLATDPVKRYQTAAEFVVALRWTVEALQFIPAQLLITEHPLNGDVVTSRSLSRESVQDKVHQELLYKLARGKAMTRFASFRNIASAAPYLRSASHGLHGHWLAYMITSVVALIALLVFGLAFNKILLSQPITPAISAYIATPSGVQSGSAPIATAFASALPMSGSPPYISMPSGSPAVTPTAKSVGKPFLVAPIASPTLTPTVNMSPTVAFPNGRPIIMSWDATGFRLNNRSSQNLTVSNFAFEQLSGSGQITLQFEGSRWTRYYPTLYPGACLIVESKRGAATYTHADCPTGVNSRTAAQSGETFWLAQNGAITFRVLWNKIEVGRCTIAAPPCALNLPPS